MAMNNWGGVKEHMTRAPRTFRGKAKDTRGNWQPVRRKSDRKRKNWRAYVRSFNYFLLIGTLTTFYLWLLYEWAIGWFYP